MTPQNSQLYLAALLEEAGFDHFDALQVARKAHAFGFRRTPTGGEQRAILEHEMRLIRDTALLQIEALTRVIDEHYYCDISADVEEDLSLLEWRRSTTTTTTE